MDYQEFWQGFRNAELEADAFTISTIGYQLYPALRTRLYYQLAQQLGVFQDPHPLREQGEAQVLEGEPSVVFGSSKVIVVPFARKVGGLDPYSQTFLDSLPTGTSVLEVSDSSAAIDLERIKRHSEAKYDRDVYEYMLREKVREVKDRWKSLDQAFENQLGTDLGKFAQFPAWWVRRYISQCLGFKEFFTRVQAKDLYMVNAYSHPAVVVGAKQAGTRVTEIQHGFISPTHPAYAYPKIRIQSAPNRIALWGKYWKDTVPFPKGVKTFVSGQSSEFARSRLAASMTAREPNTILFSSQGAIGAELFSQAVAWAKVLPDYRITFRLHPNEDLNDFKVPAGVSNLHVSHKTPSFLQLLASNEIVVGVFSTTLYEALAFGARVIVLPISGYENAIGAINRGDMTLATDNPSQTGILELLKSAKPAADPNYYYALNK